MSASTPALKAVTIKKGGNIKPAVISEHEMTYDSLNDNNMDDPKVLDELIRTIKDLDKAGHEQIYLTLRKTKPAKFFAANCVDTRFNMYNLSVHERNELKRIIDLCHLNMKREQVLKDAEGTHRQEIAKLDEKLHLTDIEDEDNAYIDSVNPTEVDKIKEMLRMNGN